jgi:hypothetical protein
LNFAFEWLGNYLSKHNPKTNPNFIFSTFLELFFKEEEYYSEFNQGILERLVEKIVNHPLIDIDFYVSREQIITLTKNYNFNSFGNQAFTLLLLAMTCSISPEK